MYLRDTENKQEYIFSKETKAYHKNKKKKKERGKKNPP